MPKFNVGDTVYTKEHEYFDVDDLKIIEGTINYISEKTNWNENGVSKSTKYVINFKKKRMTTTLDEMFVFKTKEDVKRTYIKDIQRQIKQKQEEIEHYNKVIKKLEREVNNEKH